MAVRQTFKPRKRPVQERSRFTVDQIIEAAARVFAARGYAGTTTNYIAERAGVSIGSLYQYFPNKDAILVALTERHIAATSRVLQAMIEHALVAEAAFDQLLRMFVSKMLDMHTNDPRLQHVLLFEAPRSREVAAMMHRAEDAMCGAVGSLLVRRQRMPPRQARRAAYLVVHVVETLAHEFVVHPPEQMNQTMFVDHVVMLLGGYIRTLQEQ